MQESGGEHCQPNRLCPCCVGAVYSKWGHRSNACKLHIQHPCKLCCLLGCDAYCESQPPLPLWPPLCPLGHPRCPPPLLPHAPDASARLLHSLLWMRPASRCASASCPPLPLPGLLQAASADRRGSTADGSSGLAGACSHASSGVSCHCEVDFQALTALLQRCNCRRQFVAMQTQQPAPRGWLPRGRAGTSRSTLAIKPATHARLHATPLPAGPYPARLPTFFTNASSSAATRILKLSSSSRCARTPRLLSRAAAK